MALGTSGGKYHLPFVVVPGLGPTLLGINWLEVIQLRIHQLKAVNTTLPVEDIIQRYADFFKTKLSELRNYTASSRVNPNTNCPVGWGCRIHQLLLCRGVRPSPNECPGYDTKQSDGEVPAMLELWEMQSTPLLPLLPGPLCPGVVAPDKGPIYGSNGTKPCFFHYTDFCI